MNICNKCKNYYPNNHYCQYWDCDVTIQHEMCCGFANMTNADCNQQRRLTMMSDCISRKALLDRYDAEHVGLPGRARELIATAPAADVVEVRHGRWIGIDSSFWKPTHRGDIPVFRKTYRCSECRRRTAVAENYCPNCGDKMDKEVADETERTN